MRIIISPAKQMKENSDTFVGSAQPVLLEKTQEILSWMENLSYEEAKKLWACSDKIAQDNYEKLQNMNLQGAQTPAVLAYDGIAFKYMAPDVFSYDEFDYVQNNLRILSGFYGALKPMDKVTGYRLEMQARAKVAGSSNLYDYWGKEIYDQVMDHSRTIINLASKEYSKCVEKFLESEDRFITCIFAEEKGDKLVQKGVYAKMARGEMVRFMAENAVEDPEEIKAFDRLGYKYSPEHSDENTYVFIMESKENNLKD